MHLVVNVFFINLFYSGLGIGTTPAALIKHGIETTIVEIDPVVHKFASEYFHLPSNHIAEIEDATAFVQRSQKSNSAQYDYIVHDVFTGGTEPVELFTLEFMRGLHALLKPDGVIAIVTSSPSPASFSSFQLEPSLLIYTAELRWRHLALSCRPCGPYDPSCFPNMPHLPRRRPSHTTNPSGLHQHGDFLQKEQRHSVEFPRASDARFPR